MNNLDSLKERLIQVSNLQTSYGVKNKEGKFTEVLDIDSVIEFITNQSKTHLEKIDVCNQCYSNGILFIDCVCAYGKHKTIELEFEVCSCCGNLIEDGHPADTDFNKRQLKK